MKLCKAYHLWEPSLSEKQTVEEVHLNKLENILQDVKKKRSKE